MYRHQTLNEITKQLPKKLNQALCTICFTKNMTTSPKEKKVDTNNFQPVEIIRMYFDFYNITSICGFTSMLTVVYENTGMLWVFHTACR